MHARARTHLRACAHVCAQARTRANHPCTTPLVTLLPARRRARRGRARQGGLPPHLRAWREAARPGCVCVGAAAGGGVMGRMHRPPTCLRDAAPTHRPAHEASTSHLPPPPQHPAVSGNRPAPSPDSEAGVQAAERTGEVRHAEVPCLSMRASAFAQQSHPLVRAGSKGEHKDSILPLPQTSEVGWMGGGYCRQRSQPPIQARKRTHCPPPAPTRSTCGLLRKGACPQPCAFLITSPCF